jgi:ribonuclease HI
MLKIYTDGAARGNPGPGGAGVVIVFPDGRRRRLSRPLGHTTNNRAELLAVRVALEAVAAEHETPMQMCTDSQNVIGWLTGVYRVHSNAELISELRTTLTQFRQVQFVKVAGHSGDPGNEDANLLAQRAARGVSIDEWSGHPDVSPPWVSLATEVAALLARLRQFHNPALAEAEAALHRAHTVLQNTVADRTRAQCSLAQPT